MRQQARLSHLHKLCNIFYIIYLDVSLYQFVTLRVSICKCSFEACLTYYLCFNAKKKKKKTHTLVSDTPVHVSFDKSVSEVKPAHL